MAVNPAQKKVRTKKQIAALCIIEFLSFMSHIPLKVCIKTKQIPILKISRHIMLYVTFALQQGWAITSGNVLPLELSTVTASLSLRHFKFNTNKSIPYSFLSDLGTLYQTLGFLS